MSLLWASLDRLYKQRETPLEAGRHRDKAEAREAGTGAVNVFFHIGLHKTASTWFQNHLFTSLEDVHCLVTRRIGDAPRPSRDAPIVIVSHEGLSGTLSSEKRPDDNKRRLAETLAAIAATAPDAAIIIGFREHASWLAAAYAQKAKKEGVRPERYLATFSMEDLSWCRSLDLIEAASGSVFPFLYEELSHAPKALIEDLCLFLGTRPPGNLDQLLSIRENSSPRSEAGQLVSRPFFQLSYAIKRVTRLDTKALREFGGRLGARLDHGFAPLGVDVAPELARVLREDWSQLLRRVGNIRGRDLPALIVVPTTRDAVTG